MKLNFYKIKKPIFTALSPNTETDDILLALKLLLMPWKWRKGSERELLNEKLSDLMQGRTYVFESGRSAFLAILKCLNLPKESEVILQAYTCVAVPNSVIWAGLKPVYIDIDPYTFNMSARDLEEKISARSRVLLIQHTFGLPADMDKLLVIAKKHNLFVIEDCAHSLGSEYKEIQTGNFGDAAFFSFGRDKVISSVFGGFAVIRNDELAHKMELLYHECNEPSKKWIVQQLLQPIITFFAKKTYNILVGKIILWLSKRMNLLSKAVYPQEKYGQKPRFLLKKMPNALAILAMNQLAKLDKFNNHRRQIAKVYNQELKDLDFLTTPNINSDVTHIYLRYNILSARSEKLFGFAKKENIFLGDWYNSPIAPRGINYQAINYIPKSCPVAEEISAKSINLPTDIHVTKNDALRIAKFIKNAN